MSYPKPDNFSKTNKNSVLKRNGPNFHLHPDALPYPEPAAYSTHHDDDVVVVSTIVVVTAAAAGGGDVQARRKNH